MFIVYNNECSMGGQDIPVWNILGVCGEPDGLDN